MLKLHKVKILTLNDMFSHCKLALRFYDCGVRLNLWPDGYELSAFSTTVGGKMI